MQQNQNLNSLYFSREIVDIANSKNSQTSVRKKKQPSRTLDKVHKQTNHKRKKKQQNIDHIYAKGDQFYLPNII